MTDRIREEPVPIREAIDAIMSRMHLAIEADEKDRQALPCFVDETAGRLSEAADACEEVKAYECCRFASMTAWCSRERIGAAYRGTADRLVVAGVPKLYADRVLAARAGGPAVPRPLLDTDSLVLVRAFVRATREVIALPNGQAVTFAGDDWLLVLAGPTGTGKSVAAAFAVAEKGGAWLSARALERPATDTTAAEATRLLVLDEAGREYVGEARYATDRLAGLLESRHADQRRTIVTTNLRRHDFTARYAERVTDRLNEKARFVALPAGSLRGQL